MRKNFTAPQLLENTLYRQSSVEMKTLPVNLHVKHTVAVHRLLFAVVQTDARTHTA